MSWKNQLADCITSADQLGDHFDVDSVPLRAVTSRYPLRITPHYLALIETPDDPIGRQCIPDLRELENDGLPEDSLNEAAFRPVPAIVHRYADRALLMVSGHCAGYCRFCTRKSRVGTAALCFSAAQIDEGIRYLADTPQIRDVILTGGDPLLLDDEVLEEWLARLHRLPHLDIIRLGTRVPVTLPDRITPALCRLLSRFQPIYLNTHFNHPRELTESSARACARLADAGMVLGNQTVLLAGVNDDSDVLTTLNRGLLKMRVRPYYLHHLDQARGTSHFRVPLEVGLAIMAGLRGRIAGLGIPQYVVDPPGGEGKVPLDQEHLLSLGETFQVKTATGIVTLPNRPA